MSTFSFGLKKNMYFFENSKKNIYFFEIFLVLFLALRDIKPFMETAPLSHWIFILQQLTETKDWLNFRRMKFLSPKWENTFTLHDWISFPSVPNLPRLQKNTKKMTLMPNEIPDLGMNLQKVAVLGSTNFSLQSYK